LRKTRTKGLRLGGDSWDFCQESEVDGACLVFTHRNQSTQRVDIYEHGELYWDAKAKLDYKILAQAIVALAESFTIQVCGANVQSNNL
jgi:hypothetical protein